MIHFEILSPGRLVGRTAFIYVRYEKYGCFLVGIFVSKPYKLSFLLIMFRTMTRNTGYSDSK